MPPTDYLSVSGIDQALNMMPATYPNICTQIILPEKSIEGRTMLALKLANGTGPKRRGVLFLGGLHARELINPDLLIALTLKVCDAYTNGQGLAFEGKVFPADTIKLLIESMDIFIMPLVNPDGRAFVQQANGDAWWRRNRNPNPGLPCMGVDINRNFDFLHSSGIGTATYSCADEYRGTGAFSEPETRNVRHMLEAFPNIMGLVDLHSFSEVILYPWGDDNNQTTDSNMNFRNPAFNGLRGVPNDDVYREYIRQGDLDFFVKTANRMRDAIAAVRGTVYSAEPGVLLYPYSATSADYAYSRSYIIPSLRTVYAFAIETGKVFQPPLAEAQKVMTEVSAGLLQFCESMLETVVPYVVSSPLAAARNDVLDADLVPEFTGGGGSGPPYVVSQSPNGGTIVTAGSIVKMHLANGPPP